MPVEIERKFLVVGDGWRDGVSRERRLRQAYLAKNDNISLRVRIDGRETATLTIKSAAAGIARNEYEYDLPVSDALELIELREGAVIEKRRYIVPIGTLEWEIDVFEGDNAGLVIAEVELPSPDTPLYRPNWLGEEVTSDRRFYNADLSRNPFSRWPRSIRLAGTPTVAPDLT